MAAPAAERTDAGAEALPAPGLPEITRLLRGDLSVLRTIDWRIFWSALPVLAFLVLNGFWPEDLWRTQVAIVGSFAAAAWVFANNRDRGVIRVIAVMSFVVVSASAVVGLALNSAKAFAAQNIVADFLMAAICLGSVAIRKPLVGAVARESVPALRTLLAPDHRLFAVLTLTFMAMNLATAVFRIFLLDWLATANEYVIVTQVTGRPLSAAFVVVCYFAIKRAARAVEAAAATPDHVPTG